MSVNSPNNPNLELLKQQLLAWRRRWRRLRLAGFLRHRLPPVVLMSAAALAILDLILALPQTARLWLFGFALAALLLLVGHQIRVVLRFGLRDTAFWLDRLSGLKRRPTLTVFELLNPSHPRSGESAPGQTESGGRSQTVSPFHLQRLARRVENGLGGLSPASAKGTVFPAPPKRWLLLPLVILILVVLLPGGRISLARVGAPWLDIPPWSPCRFQVHPSPVRVVYGDGMEIKVSISGHPPDRDVYLETRGSGGSRKTICFQEGNSVFSQRLENVTAPLRFCFSTGRARSHWQAVELLMRPRVLEAVVTLQPPAYSHLEARTFELGKRPVRGLPGTRLTVHLTTNRPLREGTVRIIPLELENWRTPGGSEGASQPDAGMDPGDALQVTQNIDGVRAAFSWIMTAPADVHIQVVGMDGLAGTAPINLRQTVVPDPPPATEIIELPSFALATPESIVKVGVQAEDDLGLAQVDLVRTVAGFRDRALEMDVDPGTITYASAMEFDLAQLGVVPGEVLEFFAEGRDTNPDLTGIASSRPSRLQIISREDYAKILRKRTTMKEFFTRFAVAAETVQNLQKTLNDMREGLQTGRWTTRQLDEARKTAAEQATRAAELFEQMGKDFPIYELDPMRKGYFKHKKA